MLGSVTFSKILYASTVWKKYMKLGYYRARLERLQRQAAIKISGAYRTTSTKALQVVASSIPIHLLVEERSYEPGTNTEAKKREREEEREKASWKRKLVEDVDAWIGRAHGSVNYFITPFLTGHGCFGSYLKKMGLTQTEGCCYCGEKDTPKHTIFECKRWREERSRAERKYGKKLNTENINTDNAGKRRKMRGSSGYGQRNTGKKRKRRKRLRERIGTDKNGTSVGLKEYAK